MIDWIAVKEAGTWEDFHNKWMALPKETRYAAYGGLGGGTMAMLIHRLMGTDHRKGRTIGWGALGALTGAAGGGVTGYTESKISPFVKKFLTDINGTVNAYKNNVESLNKNQNAVVNRVNGLIEQARGVLESGQQAVDKATGTIEELGNTVKGVNKNLNNAERVSNAAGDFADAVGGTARGIYNVGKEVAKRIRK